MSQNGQTHLKNLAANAVRFLKGVWPFWVIMHERVKIYENIIFTISVMIGDDRWSPLIIWDFYA